MHRGERQPERQRQARAMLEARKLAYCIKIFEMAGKEEKQLVDDAHLGRLVEMKEAPCAENENRVGRTAWLTAVVFSSLVSLVEYSGNLTTLVSMLEIHGVVDAHHVPTESPNVTGML